MKRITIAALGLVVGTTAGCVDMGLDGNVPLEEAQDRPPKDLVAALYRPTETVAARIIVDGRLWVPSGRPLTADPSDLRAVGAAEGRTVYARRWDQAPYDALLMEAPAASPGARPAALMDPARWIELQPVLGRTGPVPAAEREHGPTTTGGAAGRSSGH